MANITPVALDQNKSDKCRVKSIKGFFKYNDNRENSGALVKSLIKEIADGVYLNFIVRYFWCGENGNDCYLEIGWEPAYLNNGVRERYSKGLSEYFGADNACEVVINGESITLLAGRSDNKQTLDSYSMKIFDDTLEPAWIGMVNSLDPSIKNIEITFNYANSQNDGIDTYINIDGLNKVKILRPSKYENNVVFNRDGLNEMIDYFKKYPVVDLTTSEKYGHIRISHGNPENDIDIAPYGFEAGTQDELLCSVDFLPSEHATYSIGKNGKDDIIYDTTKNYYKFEDNQLTAMRYLDGMFFAGEPITDNIINVSFNGLGTITTRSVFVNLNQELQIIQFGELTSDSFRIEDYQLEVLDLTTNSLLTEEDIESEYTDTTVLITFLRYEFNHEYQLSLTVPNQRARSNQTKKTIISFLDLNDLVEEEQLQNPPLKWKNLFLSDTLQSDNGIFNKQLKAKEIIVKDNIQGKFVGTPSGQSININDNFIVNASGDVQLKGNITWGQNQFMYVYHKGKNGVASEKPDTPTNSTIYEEDVTVSNMSKVWHKNYNSHSNTDLIDHWISMTFDGGANWSTPTYINAKDGEKGDDGYWTNENILKALESVNQDGLFQFPNGTGENGKLGINASVIHAALGSFNQLQMDPGANYNGVSDKTFNGGYISFAIPSPFEPLSNGNYPCISGSKPGWRARLGYLRGNGDMQTATAGIGFAIYTDATWNDRYAPLTCSDGTESENKHLVLSTLMLTQSGLGILTVQNTNHGGTNPQLWMDYDVLRNDENTQVPHYIYRYWGGEKISKRWNRLWLDEHNGCLYWSNGSTVLKRWDNPSDA